MKYENIMRKYADISFNLALQTWGLHYIQPLNIGEYYENDLN
jgi:hypothetical protein